MLHASQRKRHRRRLTASSNVCVAPIAAQCDPPRSGGCTAEEISHFRTAVSIEDLWFRCLLELAYILGWRRGELLKLRVRDVNIAEQTIKIETSKNAEPRECGLSPTLAALIQQPVSGRGQDELVFERQDIRYAWARVVKTAKVPNAHWHDWRRTAARAKRAAGVDTSIILKMQGWKTDGMMRRYAIVDLYDQRAALSRVDELAHETHTAKEHYSLVVEGP